MNYHIRPVTPEDLKDLQAISREANKQIIWFGVYEKNLSAQKFYAKNRFKRFSQHTYQVGMIHKLIIY